MKTRWHMENISQFVEAENTAEGRQKLVDLRKDRPDMWKRCSIKNIIQAYPSNIATHRVYLIDGAPKTHLELVRATF